MILLLRHGQIVQSEPRCFVGQRDIPLDATGRAQALAMQRHLAHRPLERVIASDLGRCMETATLVSQGRGLVVEPEPLLREVHLGRWQGLTTDQVKAQFGEEYEARGRDMAGARPGGGESFQDVAARVVPCFERIVRESQGNVLVVAHGGVNRVLLCHVLGLELARLFRLGQDYCCLNLIARKEDAFVLQGMNVAAPV